MFLRISGIKRFGVILAAVILVFYLLQSFLQNFFYTSNKFQPVKSIGDAPRNSGVFDPGIGLCSVSKPCEGSQLAFNLSASVSELFRPQACINNLLILASDKVVKGLNVVIINEMQKAVEDIKYFDFVSGDRELVSFMQHVARNRIILVTSWGDISTKLTTDSREVLRKYGSKLVETLKPGDSFVMVGQKGLASGEALERVGKLSPQDGDAFISLIGCVKIPMGTLSAGDSNDQQRELPPIGNIPAVVRHDNIVYGAELPHCGRKDPCRRSEIAISVYSGKDKDDEPKICVNGRFVISRNLNKAGRGLNIVVLNATAREVLRVGHFDTYQEDSTTLEIFLEDLAPRETVVVVSFDEASTKLSTMVKQIFYELGSGLIQNLKFRASWYLIGQKGINGFSPFEEMNYANNAEWARAIDRKLCVPMLLDGQRIRPDPVAHVRNDAKRHFCTKYDGYEEFCDEAHLDDVITPAPIFNKSLEGHEIFSVPLLVVAGLAHNSLRLCLETIVRQPGVRLANVLVTFDENYSESHALAQLFGVKSMGVSASTSYSDQLAKSLEIVWKQFSNAEVVIVIEEELMLTGDFLFFMSQMLRTLRADESLLSVSAWNDNGFVGSSSLPDTVYHVEGFPGLGFMLRKSTYTSLLMNKTKECCANRAWDGWLSAKQLEGRHMLVPDVSRVYRRHAEGLGLIDSHVEDLFHRARTYNTLPTPIIKDANLLAAPDSYDALLRRSLSRANRVREEQKKALLDKCRSPSEAEQILKIEGDRKEASFLVDYVDEELYPLLRCFGLYYSKGRAARGVYKGVLRFSLNGGVQGALVSRSSPLRPDEEGQKQKEKDAKAIRQLEDKERGTKA